MGKLGVGRSDGYPYDVEKPAGGEYTPVTGGLKVPLVLPPPALADAYPPEELPIPPEVWKPLGEYPPDNPTVELDCDGLGLVDEGKDDGRCGGM